MSAAETLREAAALMRERAEGSSAGPWHVEQDGDSGEMYVIGERYIADVHEWSTGLANPQHIASWHPAVALAVADWLDAEATALDAMAVFTSAAASIEHEVDITGAALTVRKDEKGGVSLVADTSAPALAVAHAYLGTTP